MLGYLSYFITLLVVCIYAEPESAIVEFSTSVGDIELYCQVQMIYFRFCESQVKILKPQRSWGPIGFDRFMELVASKYYDGNVFFRFGLSNEPSVTAKWKNLPIQDEPVKLSNTRGVLSFAKAGPNTRTTQLFINLEDNVGLDGQGFSGVCQVRTGMELVGKITAEYGQKPNQVPAVSSVFPDKILTRQGEIVSRGGAYLEENFPNLDFIITARIADTGGGGQGNEEEKGQEEKDGLGSEQLVSIPPGQAKQQLATRYVLLIAALFLFVLLFVLNPLQSQPRKLPEKV